MQKMIYHFTRQRSKNISSQWKYIFISVGFNFLVTVSSDLKFLFQCFLLASDISNVKINLPQHIPALNFLVLCSINIIVKAKLQRLSLGFYVLCGKYKFFFLSWFLNAFLLLSPTYTSHIFYWKVVLSFQFLRSWLNARFNSLANHLLYMITRLDLL